MYIIRLDLDLDLDEIIYVLASYMEIQWVSRSESDLQFRRWLLHVVPKIRWLQAVAGPKLGFSIHGDGSKPWYLVNPKIAGIHGCSSH